MKPTSTFPKPSLDSQALSCSLLRSHSHHESGDNSVPPDVFMMKATNDQAGLGVDETIPSAGVCSWAGDLHFPQYQHRPCQYKWWDKVVIQLILRSRSGQMCHSCKALLLMALKGASADSRGWVRWFLLKVTKATCSGHLSCIFDCQTGCLQFRSVQISRGPQ